ncbi:membrane protein FAM174B-like [Brienomyrus brachyistius]|uniref:membrane protein FAM174B-like n=1 Tax=Brienomyrus brachyistius TaxID=42636 RepID=UPI0020B22F51|nr:membrane protein FAM174B-like [Brienomyrus brachyistius]
MPVPLRVCLAIALAVAAHGELRTMPAPSLRPNRTASIPEPQRPRNGTLSVGAHVPPFLGELATLRAFGVIICVSAVLLITCLVAKVYRSGRKVGKTRRYDIITTPAERIEMAPLNEENEDEEDSTLFDIKYR